MGKTTDNRSATNRFERSTMPIGMRNYRIRHDLERDSLDGFDLPLGVVSADRRAPVQGYTLSYVPGEEDEPDSYAFHVVVTHPRVAPILHKAFELLPPEVVGIVEIGSRDAYRTVDVYLGASPVSRRRFLATWRRFEPLLLEECLVAAGANSEEPFIEIFLDQWKGIGIHVPLGMRDDVEAMLTSFGLEEVIETWPIADDESSETEPEIRPVLELVDEFSPDLDELILELRHDWALELNVDPERNADESGRNLGYTLWHAVVIVENANGNPDDGAYASIWATANSLAEMETLIDVALEDNQQWEFGEVYTIDRVAFDERPNELVDLPPRRDLSEVHLVNFEAWKSPPKGVAGD